MCFVCVCVHGCIRIVWECTYVFYRTVTRDVVTCLTLMKRNPDEEEHLCETNESQKTLKRAFLSSGCKPPQLHAKREQLSFPQKKGDGFTRQDTSTSSAAKSSAVTFTANPLAGHTFRSIAIIGCRQSILKAVLRGLCVSVNQYRPDSFSYMH